MFTSAAITVSGNGAYGSGNFAPASAGTYWWVATYTGDLPNTTGPVSTACGDANESSVISPKTPTIVTNAVAGPLPIGSNVSDTATIGNTAPKVNGDPAGGSVTFRLYGPSATAVCTAANLVFTSAAITVSGNGAYGSGNFAPASAGTYWWVATYTGDLPNTTGPVSTACGDANESSVISPKTPTIVTNAVAGPLPIGSNVSDTATIGNTAPKVNGDPAGGSVTFRLYGPSATAVCTAANLVFTSAAITVSGNGAYGSGNFAPASAGTYWWVATYTGDLPNTTGPVSTACGDANESSVISPKTPTIVTNAVAGPLPIGSNVSDTATIGNTAPKVNGDPAGGSVTFRLYGPSATAVCTAANLVFTSAAITVSGNGAYGSGNFTPASAGTYSWVATYTGDLPNTTGPVSTACGDANESSVISPKNSRRS